MAKVDKANGKDIDRIAICHIAAFPNSLSSVLGLDYLRVMLRWYIVSENAFLLLIKENDLCLGYCGGMIRRTSGMGSASSMAQYSFKAATIAFIKKPWLIAHPEIRAKFYFILKNIFLRLGGKEKSSGKVEEFEPRSSLVVIGVNPADQGRGYSSLLLCEFERISLEMGFNRMSLSVRSDNTVAIKAYSKNGWMVKETTKTSIIMEKITN